MNKLYVGLFTFTLSFAGAAFIPADASLMKIGSLLLLESALVLLVHAVIWTYMLESLNEGAVLMTSAFATMFGTVMFSAGFTFFASHYDYVAALFTNGQLFAFCSAVTASLLIASIVPNRRYRPVMCHKIVQDRITLGLFQ